MHTMSANFAKTLVWKHGNDVKLWRHKQRTPKTNNHHMTLNQTPPMKICCVRHCFQPYEESFFSLERLPNTHGQGILWYGMEYGMEGKKRHGISNGSSWNGRFDGWNGTNLPYSIQIPYLPILTWCCLSPVFLSVEHIRKTESEFD